tara:strand:- start:361 stop:1284 length:924 start_codon:yes stop_codon:yes gene_type:complete
VEDKSPHIPVMYSEIADLDIKYDGIYIDCTLGFGGHSSSILEKLTGDGRLIGLDVDPYALSYSSRKLSKFEDLFIPIHSNYRNFPQVLKNLKIRKVDGMIFDLGISSYQIDEEHRGFSYINNGPIDMRMDNSSGSTALDFLKNVSKEELGLILKEYGDVRNYKKISHKIIEKLYKEKFKDTFSLRDAIQEAVSAKNINKIAAQVFQAIRIKVNNEVEVLSETLSMIPDYIDKNGFVAVISFHSIEDRLVKNFFRNNYNNKSKNKYSSLESNNQLFRFITKKPIRPTSDEVKDNPRSRSAKLRYGIAN